MRLDRLGGMDAEIPLCCDKSLQAVFAAAARSFSSFTACRLCDRIAGYRRSALRHSPSRANQLGLAQQESVRQSVAAESSSTSPTRRCPNWWWQNAARILPSLWPIAPIRLASTSLRDFENVNAACSIVSQIVDRRSEKFRRLSASPLVVAKHDDSFSVRKSASNRNGLCPAIDSSRSFGPEPPSSIAARKGPLPWGNSECPCEFLFHRPRQKKFLPLCTETVLREFADGADPERGRNAKFNTSRLLF